MDDILITGGAGFIGSHLCQRLIESGCSVTSLDNYFTGSTKNHIPGVNYISGSTETISDVLRTRQFDTIFHLGEYSRVEQSFDDIDLVWRYNKIGTYEVLKYASHTNAKLIYAGSSTKYADVHDGYVPSPYTWSKATNTELVKQYAEWYGLDYAITYFYNSYGPREIKDGKYATLIAKYKEKMRKGEPLSIVLPGTQMRNFTHVNDIVSGLLLIGENGHGDEYGIGNPTEYSIYDVAKMFGGELEELPARAGNRFSSKVITDKTKALGWQPKYNLNTYINEIRENGWNDD